MSKRGVAISQLGERALKQLRAEGYDVDKLMSKDRKREPGKLSGLASPLPAGNKYCVSAKELRTVDGICFASKLEMAAYVLLRDRRVKFERQPSYVLQEPFEFKGRKERAITYQADFKILAGDREFIIDMKGMRTPVFQLKRKLMAALGLEVVCLKSVAELTRFLHERGLLSA